MFEGKQYPVMDLKSVCSKITDGTHKTPIYLDDGIAFISAKNIIEGKVDLADIKHISVDEYYTIQKRCNVELGDLLLTKSGSLGMPAIVENDIPLGLFESLAVIKYDRTKLNGKFLYEQIRSEAVQQQLTSGIKGVAVKHLHLNVIGATTITVPPMDVQNQFAEIAKQADKSKFILQIAIYRDVWGSCNK